MTMGRTAFVLSFGILLCSSQQALAEGAVDGCDGSPACVEDLRDVTDALDESNGRIIGEAGAEKAREMDTSHDIALEEEGRDYGLYYGNRIDKVSQWPDASGQDCTTFVLDVLEEAFAKAGAQGCAWRGRPSLFPSLSSAIPTPGSEGINHTVIANSKLSATPRLPRCPCGLAGPPS